MSVLPVPDTNLGPLDEPDHDETRAAEDPADEQWNPGPRSGDRASETLQRTASDCRCGSDGPGQSLRRHLAHRPGRRDGAGEDPGEGLAQRTGSGDRAAEKP